MKNFKRILCLVLALILSLGICLHASAVEPRASAYLRSYLAYCYPETDGSISVWFEVEGTGTEEALGVLTILLQEQVPGTSDWSTVATYRHTDYPDLLSYNDNFHYGHVDYEKAIPGYHYRAYVTIWGGGLEIGDTRYYTTETVTALTPTT